MNPFNLLGLLSPLITQIINLVGEKLGVDMTSDDTKVRMAEIELQAKQMINDQLLGQLEINKQEARHESVFVAGWRPFVGWVCGFAFGYHFLFQPLLVFIIAASGHHIDLPDFDMQNLLTVLLGMLGLGGLRTFEKVRREKAGK